MEPLLHECGVAMIRLRKPLNYYQEKYGTWAYGMNKMFLLMNKQYNRGQQGAGIACVKLKASPGEDYMFRENNRELFKKFGVGSSTLVRLRVMLGDMSAGEEWMEKN